MWSFYDDQVFTRLRARVGWGLRWRWAAIPEVATDPDRVRRERCALGGPVARVDHPEQQSAGLAIQPVQRAGGEQPRPDPVLAERRAVQPRRRIGGRTI